MTGFSTVSAASIDSLLAERDFVRRLAEGLLFDAHEVEDVVQQTWLAALQRPPAAGGVRSWLARVVHNRAQDHRRRSARRRRHERIAAEAPVRATATAEPADAVLAREDERHRVVEALRALSEPYRSVVALRYFEQLEPGTIAKQRGVPAATVRSQLKRGLDQMRTRLDAEHGGDGKAWMLAIVPVWHGSSEASAATTGLTTAAVSGVGGLAMLKKLLLLSVPLLMLLGAWWLIDDRSADDDDFVSATATPMLADGPVGTSPPQADPDTGARSVADAAHTTKTVDTITPAMARFVGRLLLPDGTPAAACRVTTLGLDGARMMTPATVRDERFEGTVLKRSTKTDDDGRFELAGVWPRAVYMLRADGEHRTLFRSLNTTPGPGETRDLGDLTFADGGAVVGTVLDLEGKPLPDAEVVVADVPSIVANVVRLQSFDPTAGAIMMLPKVTSPDPANPSSDARTTIRSYLGRTLFQEMGIEPGDQYDAVVLDGPAWTQSALSMLPMHRTKTDASGQFELRGLPIGRSTLMIRHADALAQSRAVSIRAAKPRKVKIKLRTGETMAGRVIDAKGQPAAGAEVRVAPLGRLPSFGIAMCEPAVTTGPDGRFACARLPRGRALVAARPSPDAAWTVLGPAEVDEEIELRLAATFDVPLTVRTVHGKPMTVEDIELFEGAFMTELSALGLQRQLPTDDVLRDVRPGHCTLHLPAGVYGLRLRAKGSAPVVTTLRVPSRPVALRVEEAMTVPVRVLDPDGQPLAGASVHAVVPRSWDSGVLPTDYSLPFWNTEPAQTQKTDQSGTVTLEHLPASLGPVPDTNCYGMVHASHPRYAHASAEIASTHPRLIEIRLRRAGSISGRLSNGTQAANGQNWRLVADPKGAPLSSKYGLRFPERRHFAVPNAEGMFEFVGLAPDDYDIEVWPQPSSQDLTMTSLVDIVGDNLVSFFRPKAPNSIRCTVVAGGTVEVALDVQADRVAPGQPSGGLAGSILWNGKAPPNARIYRGSMNSETVLATPDAQGRFQRHDLPLGDLDVTIGDPARDLVYWSGSVKIEAGRATPLNLRLQSASLRAVLSPEDRVDISNKRINVSASIRTANGNCYRSGRIDANGAVVFEDVPFGTVNFSAYGAGGFTGKLEVEFTQANAGAVLRIPVHRQPHLTGSVLLEGARPKVFMVRLVRKIGDHGWQTRSVSIDSDNRFDFHHIQRANYQIKLSAPGYEFECNPNTLDLRNASKDLDLTIVEVSRRILDK